MALGAVSTWNFRSCDLTVISPFCVIVLQPAFLHYRGPMERNLIAALAACLVFQGELLAGKRLLPQFGGSAYVWCATLLFFQLVLIGGYYGSRRLAQASPRARQTVLAALGASGLLALLPRLPAAAWLPAELQPLMALLPFAGLSTALFCTTPLLHQAQPDRSNFKIYAWSNAGALAGLAIYPLAVEPLTGLTAQTWGWALGGLAICLFGFRKTANTAPLAGASTVSTKTKWQWWVLPAVSSATLLAATNQLGYEASAGPLTWALPLALFLGSYIWAFSGDRRSTLALISAVGLIALLAANIAEARSPQMLGFLLLGAAASMAAIHTWLAATRTEDTHRFYRASAIGGALGSAVMVLIVPRITSGPMEFSVLTLTTLSIAGFGAARLVLRFFLITLAVVAIGITIATASAKRVNDIARTRGLYGCLRVTQRPGREFYSLISNTTVHGAEDRQAPERGMTYFGKASGVGQILQEKQAAAASLDVGVIGLGTGTISRLLRPEDSITYYEINPQVEALARKFFTYLNRPKTRVVIGDGRKCLEAETAQFDVLVLDAFTGDAIPTHLLTREAGCVYQARLKKPHGALAIHITNAHVDLRPVVEGLAQSMGMSVEIIRADKVDWAILRPGKTDSARKLIPWTDERSSLLGALKR